MYKKIKNSSFMNLIWFIIAIIPLLFIFIDLNNDENKTKTIENLALPNVSNQYIDYFEINQNVDTTTLFNHNENVNYYDFSNGDVSPLKIQIDISPNENINLYNYFAIMPLYYDEDDEPTIIDNANFSINIVIDNDEYIYSHFYENTKIALFNFSCNTNNYIGADMLYDISIYRHSSVNVQGFRIYFFASTERFENDLILENNFVIQTKPNFYWFNKFTSNGFISNAFLNLAQLFGVTNVYYSLACYYIEYLLVIALLHLAFDVLYMLPNICHKFMEKIGGKRD